MASRTEGHMSLGGVRALACAAGLSLALAAGGMAAAACSYAGEAQGGAGAPAAAERAAQAAASAAGESEAERADAQAVLDLVRSDAFRAGRVDLSLPEGVALDVTVSQGRVWVVQHAPAEAQVEAEGEAGGADEGAAEGAEGADEARAVADAATPEGEEGAAEEVPAQGAEGEGAGAEALARVAEGAPASALRAWALALELSGCGLPDGEASYDPRAQGEEAEGEAEGAVDGDGAEPQGGALLISEEAGGDAGEPEAFPAVSVTWVVLGADGACEQAFELPADGTAPAMGADGWDVPEGASEWVPSASELSPVLVPAEGAEAPAASWWVSDDAAEAAGDALPAASAGETPSMPDGTACEGYGRADEEKGADGAADGQQAQADAGDSKSQATGAQQASGTQAPQDQTGSASGASSGNGTTGTNGGAAGGTTNTGSGSTSGTASTPSQKTWHETRAAYDEQVWVQDGAAYDEQVWVQDGAAWEESVWVVDSAEYDETVLVSEGYWTRTATGSHYVFHYDGHCAYSDQELGDYAWYLIQTYGYDAITSYYVDYDYADVWVEPVYTTVHHDATGHYETVTHEATGHYETVHHDATGHYETVHHDAEGYWG